MTMESYRYPASAWRLPAMLAAIPERIRLALRRRRTLIELNELSDHYLHDIGIDRPEISERVKREIAWNGLLNSGWQRSRQSHRR